MQKILVIEDDESYIDNIKILLEEEDYSVVTALNGSEGIQRASKENPDLIICDIMLPDISGHSVLEELRKRQKTKFVPFIFLTAKSSASDVREGMNLGADDYLTKPFLANDLLKAVETRLEKYKLLLKAVKSSKNSADEKTKLDHDNYVLLPTGKNYEMVYVEDIVCITSEGVYTNVFTKDGKKVLMRKLLKEWEKTLSEKKFTRVHKSTLINLTYVGKIEKWFNGSFKLLLKNFPEPLIVSRRYSALLKKNLMI
ncbi:MAG: response regulator [Ignavibacteriales bacterium]|nr:response regulator [Ignavibacteriales bacterium]